MKSKKNNVRKNPLTKAQNRLLRESLRNLLGNGLLQNDAQERESQIKAMILKNALNRMILE